MATGSRASSATSKSSDLGVDVVCVSDKCNGVQPASSAAANRGIVPRNLLMREILIMLVALKLGTPPKCVSARTLVIDRIAPWSLYGLFAGTAEFAVDRLYGARSPSLISLSNAWAMAST